MNRVETARPRTSGVNRQLLRVFLLQMGFISAITVLGVYAAAKVCLLYTSDAADE